MALIAWEELARRVNQDGEFLLASAFVSRTMEGLGHFPMSEDPERFLGYLRPVLEEIQAAGEGDGG